MRVDNITLFIFGGVSSTTAEPHTAKDEFLVAAVGPLISLVLAGRGKGFMRRIDRDMLVEVAFAAAQQPLCMVCGPTPLVEAVASTLVELGHSPDRIKTEIFGPTGG